MTRSESFAMPPVVSILIPAYNGAAFLPEALASVRAQTESRWEAIVVDDGSTDDSAAIVAAIARVDTRIRLVRQRNAGTQTARNTALSRATADWVALLDQDDVWHPAKLEQQLALLRSHPRANLLFCNYTDWDGVQDLRLRYRRSRNVPHGDVAPGLARGCLFQASTVMIPRRLACELGGFDPRFHYCGDWEMWLRLARHGIDARGTLAPLMRYRLWGGNESRRALRMQTEVVVMLESAIRTDQPERLRRAVAAGLREARARLELVRLAGRTALGSEFARGLWRAWCHDTRSLKLLLRCGACALPDLLGGAVFRLNVLRRLRAKYIPAAPVGDNPTVVASNSLPSRAQP